MSDEWLRKATLAGKWLRQNWGMTATGVIINERECMVGFWPPGEQQMKGKVCNDNAPRTRDWLFTGCERGHDWQSVGGCNAGCSDACGCSVPVNTCTRCGDSDYGDNAEADAVRLHCKETRS